MSSFREQSKIVKLMVKNERLVGSLYGIFARKFPEYGEFWSQLVGEEESHARWIGELFRKMKTRAMEFHAERFDIQSLRDMKSQIKAETQRAKKENVSETESFAIARTLEESLLEGKFFEIFDADSADVKVVMDNLRIATEGHLQKVKEKWRQENEKRNRADNK